MGRGWERGWPEKEGLDGVEIEGQEDGLAVLVHVSSASLLTEIVTVGLVCGVCVCCL